MGIGYQATDRGSFDYRLWRLHDWAELLRGPRRWTQGDSYLTFLGAAQTFGRFSVTPYPEILFQWSRKSYLNFGFAGAGPEFFMRHDKIIQYINASQVCFLQIMSGLSISTSFMRAKGKGGVLEFTDGPLKGKTMLAAVAYDELIKHYPADVVVQQVREAREQWVHKYRQLMDSITVPIVLTRISTSAPVTEDCYDSGARLLGTFPHLIDGPSLSLVRQHAAIYVDCTYPHERPERLIDFATRRLDKVFDAESFPHRANWMRTYNTYYPTQAMQNFVGYRLIEHISAHPDLHQRMA
jgi:hypothetical protein